MRLRKRHAWGAVLIVLFALPVLKPDGVALVEEPTGAFYGWFSESTPSAGAFIPPSTARDDDPRIRALEQENRSMWNEHLRRQETLRQRGELLTVLERSELTRLPRAVIASVVRAHDPVPGRRSVLINRGAADGVRVGDTVVMGGTYLGRVRAARASTALVQLVTDPRSRLEVFVRTSKGELLRGYAKRRGAHDGEDRLEVEFVSLEPGVGIIPVGAPVLTANADERVPAHLLVGLVSAVDDPDLDRMPVLSVRPALGLDHATEVIVLLTSDPQVAR
ncbi:MAG: rod shape-determining protein MreC [Planctomycetota bacterium]|nr:rod shape-determining protein MreC [Planctomycetota bacterium]